MPFKPEHAEKNWERNFDPQFTKQHPKDSICYIDPKTLEKFKKDFEDFNFDNRASSPENEEQSSPKHKTSVDGEEETP